MRADYWFNTVANSVVKKSQQESGNAIATSELFSCRQAKAESTASKHDTTPFLMGIDHHIVPKRSFQQPAWRLDGQLWMREPNNAPL
jgi:hypothetical protein